MSWTLSDDLEEFCAAGWTFLAARPVHHTVQLTAVTALRSLGSSAFGGAAPLFGWWTASGQVAAAFLHTPPYPGLITSLPGGAAVSLAGALGARGRRLAGINADEADAADFAAAWTSVTGSVPQIHRRMRLFQLAALVPPDPAPLGAPRRAKAADLPIVRHWHQAFGAEINDMAVTDTAAVADRVSRGGLLLWEAGGTPVAMAGVADAAAVARVGPVYTPPAYRQRGYGAAVTAAVSQAALDGGAEQVVLFTDLANPTSNALYPRLGYRPVTDRVMLRFAG